MTSDSVSNSFQPVGKSRLLEVEQAGEHVTLRTSAAYAGRLRWSVRTVGALAAAGLIGLVAAGISGGLGTVVHSLVPAASLLAIAAIAVSVFGPMFIRQRELLTIDVVSGRLRFARGQADIVVADVASIVGVYETQGWDGRNVLYFVDIAGERRPGIILASNEEAVAQACCEVLTKVLGVPSSYTNQYDATSDFNVARLSP